MTYPIFVGNEAPNIVVGQIGRLNQKADELTAVASYNLGNLLNSYVNTANLDPRFFATGSAEFPATDLDGFNLSENWLDGLTLPEGDSQFDFDPSILSSLSAPMPTFTPTALPTMPTMPGEPDDPGEPSAIPLPAKPILATPEAPEITPAGAMPAYEDYTASIPLPEPRPLNLPAVPTLSLSATTFSDVPPTFDIPEPDAALFQFTPGTHTTVYQTELEAAIKRILTGGSGLPQGVADALFERAREREIETADREIEITRDDMAARGHKYPPGALNRRLDRYRRDASAKISQLNRDQFVARYQEELRLLGDIIGRAISAEETALNAFTAGERLRFEAASMQLNMTLQVFNAKITRINAEVQLYGIKAQVFRDKLAAEETKIKLYAAQLEGQRLIGDLNKQDVELFNARLNALNSNAEIFRTRMQAYSEQFKIVDSGIALFRAKLEGNQALAGVYESDVRAFGEQVRAQTSRDERFKVKADIFSAKVGAKKVEYDAVLAGFEAQFKTAEFTRDTFLASQERAKILIQAEASRVDALSKRFAAVQAQVASKAEVAKARYTLMLGVAQAKIEQIKAAVEMMLKNGEINIQSALQAQNFSLRAKETAATAMAQLAAGYTAAASVQAGISESSSIGYGFNVSADDG